jgi:predicted RNA-binding protein
MAYYLFVAMDVARGKETVSGIDIVSTLLKEGFWAFSESAPIVPRLRRGDTVIVYLGGRERHWFVAHCRIASRFSTDVDDHKTKVLEELGLSFMKRIVEFDKVTFFKKPVGIIPIKDRLSFIADKKNYGLSLRLPVREIPSEDYQFILNEANKS